MPQQLAASRIRNQPSVLTTYQKPHVPYISAVRPRAPEKHLWSAVPMRLNGVNMTSAVVQSREAEVKI